jgi:PEP-CTERM motif
MHTRHARWLGLAAIGSLLAAAPLSAQVTIGGGWTEFDWFGTSLPLVPSTNGTFSLSPITDLQIEVTDCCIIGDQFTLSWTGTSSGFMTTSDPSAFDGVDGGCFTGSDCWAAADISKGSTILGPGSYDFTLEVIREADCGDGVCTDGAGFVRADPVPEPSTMALLATGLVSMAGFTRRKRRRS